MGRSRQKFYFFAKHAKTVMETRQIKKSWIELFGVNNYGIEHSDNKNFIFKKNVRSFKNIIWILLIKKNKKLKTILKWWYAEAHPENTSTKYFHLLLRRS